jgi:hypothetical protein
LAVFCKLQKYPKFGLLFSPLKLCTY